MLDRCPECGSKKITVEPATARQDGNGLGQKILKVISDITRPAPIFPGGRYVVRCKACGKESLVCVN